MYGSARTTLFLGIGSLQETEEFKGNYHQYLLEQPGGSESDNPEPPKEIK